MKRIVNIGLLVGFVALVAFIGYKYYDFSRITTVEERLSVDLDDVRNMHITLEGEEGASNGIKDKEKIELVWNFITKYNVDKTPQKSVTTSISNRPFYSNQHLGWIDFWSPGEGIRQNWDSIHIFEQNLGISAGGKYYVYKLVDGRFGKKQFMKIVEEVRGEQ